LNNYKDSNTITARYLADGYPICFSNHSDPFANSNYRESLLLLEIFLKLGIDIFFQTKGGKGIEDALGIVKKSVWYFTICSDNDSKMRQREPGAPDVSERFKRIKKIIANGHDVIVGINPAVPQWIEGKEKELLQKIKDHGVNRVAISPLHFSTFQIKRVKNREVLCGLLTNRMSEKYIEYVIDFNKMALNEGFEIDDVFGKTKLYDVFKKHYKCMPQNVNFINWCFSNKKTNDIVTFSEYRENIGGVMPSFPIVMRDYVRTNAPQFTHKYKFPKKSKFEDYLKFVWNSPGYPLSPSFYDSLSYIAKDDGSDYLYDESGHQLMMFNNEGFNAHVVNMNGEEVIT
jgi:DNA repair photolyase